MATDKRITQLELNNWFKKEGFVRVEFLSKKKIITTHWLDQAVTFFLTERIGFDTYYKEAAGGSLLVFEVGLQKNTVIYDGYCPILLFGFWPLKMKFKKGGILKYRKQGYLVQEKFEQYMRIKD